MRGRLVCGVNDQVYQRFIEIAQKKRHTVGHQELHDNPHQASEPLTIPVHTQVQNESSVTDIE